MQRDAPPSSPRTTLLQTYPRAPIKLHISAIMSLDVTLPAMHLFVQAPYIDPMPLMQLTAGIQADTQPQARPQAHLLC